MSMMASFQGPASFRARADALCAVQLCGMTANLKLCLDAGDDASLPAAATKWLDTSGNGYDFFLGTTAGADATDPAINGTAGARTSSEYLSSDGGDYLSYDTTIETWMQAAGKASNVVTCVSMARVASNVATHFMSTRGDLATEYGWSFAYSDSLSKLVFTQISNANAFFSTGSAGPDLSATFPRTSFFAMSLSNSGANMDYTVQVDGGQYPGTVSGGQTPTSNNPTNNMKLMAYGDAAAISPSGTRELVNIMWQGTKWSDGALMALFNCLRGRISR